MKFSISSVANVTESSSKFLDSGIHKCTFQGVTKELVKDQYPAMALNLDIEGYGAYTQNFFAPNEQTGGQRTSSMYGENPSQEEQFMILVLEILEACDPAFKDKINNGTLKLDAPTFDGLIKLLQKITAPYIGTEMEVKLVPQGSKNYNNIPGFPARVNKAGGLTIANRVIGQVGTLTLSAAELKKIETAKNAKPTDMASATGTTSGKSGDELIDGLSVDAPAVDDLPFD